MRHLSRADYELVDNECDPFNAYEGFLPMAIAIHLGKRID